MSPGHIRHLLSVPPALCLVGVQLTGLLVGKKGVKVRDRFNVRDRVSSRVRARVMQRVRLNVIVRTISRAMIRLSFCVH